MKGFKIICLECNREIVIDEQNPLDDNFKNGITGLLEMNYDFEIECKCGNKVII